MNTLLILVLSLICAGVAYTLYKKYAVAGLGKVFGFLLIYRMLFLSIQLIIFYAVYNREVDSFSFFIELKDLYADFLQYPGDVMEFLSGDYTSMHIDQSFKEYLIREPRVAFYLKVLFPFFLLSGGSFVLCNIWLTLFGTVCLVRFYSFERTHTHGKIWLLVCMVPSIAFWTVGMLKESFVIPVLFLLFSLYRTYEKSGFKNYYAVLQFVVFLFLVWNIKYYYTALFLLICIGFYYMVHVTQSMYSRMSIVACGCLLLVCLGFFHPNLKLSGIPTLLYESNLAICRLRSVAGCIPFSLDGTWFSVIKNIPMALWYTIYMPGWGQIQSITAVLAAIESYALIGLLFYMIVRWMNKKIQWDKRDVWALAFIAVIGILLILSTPNAGTFSRYRVIYLPLYCYILFKYTIPSQWLLSKGFQ